MPKKRQSGAMWTEDISKLVRQRNKMKKARPDLAAPTHALGTDVTGTPGDKTGRAAAWDLSMENAAAEVEDHEDIMHP